jgi:hypothetical protein
MFFSKKKKKEKMKESAINGVISIFGDNMRVAGLSRSFLPVIKDDKTILGSLYGLCVSAADAYEEDIDGMHVFLLSYSKIFDVSDPKEMEMVAKKALFDDEVNKGAEKTFNYLLSVADSGLSQQEAMLFMKNDMEFFAKKTLINKVKSDII